MAQTQSLYIRYLPSIKLFVERHIEVLAYFP